MPGLDLAARDIDAYLALHEKKELLRFLTAGSVDDGKSTLIGRLLFDSASVFDDQVDALRRDSSKKSGVDGAFDYSLLVDGLLSEREQGITIDVAYRYFATPKRKFIIADTPGHEQYTRNMATGASTADLAIILVDARLGVLPQTRRHTTIAWLLGIRHLVVAVNKMDLVAWDRSVFDAIRGDYLAFSRKLGLDDMLFLPLCATTGDNLVEKSAKTPWYGGPTLLDHLETVPIARDRNLTDFRMPVQLVLRPNLDFRGFAGTIASGVVKKGDTVMSLPSGRTSKVARIVTFDGDLDEAAPPLAVTLTLDDEIDVSRGDMLVHPARLPTVGRSIDATIVWMNEQPMIRGATYLLKHGTKLVSAEVSAIRHVLDVTTLAELPAERLGLNDIGRVTLTAARPLLFDPYLSNRATGAFILIDRLTNGTFGAGMILGAGDTEPADEARGEGAVTLAERARRFGHRAAAVWLVSGDEASARALERRLFDEGYAVWAPGAEREPAVVARAAADLGVLVVIAGRGNEAAREGARRAAGQERFVEVQTDDLEAALEALREADVVR